MYLYYNLIYIDVNANNKFDKDLKFNIENNQQVELALSNNKPKEIGFDDETNSKRVILNARSINDIEGYNDENKGNPIKSLNRKISNNLPESLSKTKSLKINLYKVLETSIKFRKQIIANSNESSKILYCSCCITTNKEKIINRAIEYVEQCSELGTIVKRNREIDILKKIILNKEQRIMEILPSTNVKTIIGEEEDEEELEEGYLNKLYNSNDLIKTIDLTDRTNKVLVKNIISSIV